MIGHQIVIEATDAVAAGDPVVASDKFNRLHSIDPDWPGVDEL